MPRCSALRELLVFDCCSSCHNDELDGYQSFMDWEYKGIDYLVCCGGYWAKKDEK